MADAAGPGDFAPTLLDDAWFQAVIDRWWIGAATFAELEELATVALTRDFDGPALRELAWRHDSWLEVDPLVERAIAELGLAKPTQAEAIPRRLGAVAAEWAAGRLGLLPAAREANRICIPIRFEAGREAFPPGFDPWTLDDLLDWWADPEYGPSPGEVERQLEDLLTALLGGTAAAKPERPDAPPDGLAPTLGGEAAPERPARPDVGRRDAPLAREPFGFLTDLGRGLGRRLRDRWPWGHRG
jgi:hypothetical protein